jgi:hypothetical protein
LSRLSQLFTKPRIRRATLAAYVDSQPQLYVPFLLTAHRHTVMIAQQMCGSKWQIF